MTKRMRFDYLCDNVDRHGVALDKRPEGDTVLVYSQKYGKVVEIDLCQVELEGAKRISLTEAGDLADRFGREIPEPDQDLDLACPYGCQKGKPYKSLQGKRHHMTRAHGEMWS